MTRLGPLAHALPWMMLALALLAAPASGQTEAAPEATSEMAAPAASVAPTQRPEDLETSTEAAMADPESRVPEDDPMGMADDDEAIDASENEVVVIDDPAAPIWERLREPDDAFEQCLSALRDHGTEFTLAEGPITDDAVPDCGIARPVEVTEIVPGVALNPDSVMRCATARALAGWVDEFVLPASRVLPERGEVTALEHGSTYVCRQRASGGRISEHGFGNAIDVMGFRFETGEPIPVEPRERDGTFAEAFQDAVRSAACLRFTTVLGPGTDAAHADHLHLDVKERRGGFRLCQ
jgi:hypothetical protein